MRYSTLTTIGKSLAFTMPARSSGVLYSKEKHGRGRKLSRPIDPPSAGEGLNFGATVEQF